MTPSSINSFYNEDIEAFLSHSSNDLWVGLSGGVDSVVLLHLLVSKYFSSHEPDQGHSRNRLKAIHIHHGLSPNATKWQTLCQSICQQHAIYFEAHSVDVASYEGSLEEAARLARYEVFSRQVKKNDILLLAHHADDQAETVLFRLLRGTGGKGIAGIPSSRPLETTTGAATLLRPLLNYSKKSLLEYANAQQLVWGEDESNKDTQYSRNFIRHQVVPTLREFETEASTHIAQASERLAFDYQMLEKMSFDKLSAWVREDNSLSLLPLESLSVEERQFWLRQYLQLNAISLTQPQLVELSSALCSSEDRQPSFEMLEKRLMRYQGALYILPQQQAVVTGTLTFGQPFKRPFDEIQIDLIGESSIEQQNLRVTTRPKDAVLRLSNGHSRKLKKWLNDKKIPSWWREHLPYITYQDDLVAIGSLWIAPSLSKQLCVKWRLNGRLPWSIESPTP